MRASGHRRLPAIYVPQASTEVLRCERLELAPWGEGSAVNGIPSTKTIAWSTAGPQKRFVKWLNRKTNEVSGPFTPTPHLRYQFLLRYPNQVAIHPLLAHLA
ncbi:hypothetical protein VULLAG_LOCUS11211 [Vulpes lagopus]